MNSVYQIKALIFTECDIYSNRRHNCLLICVLQLWTLYKDAVAVRGRECGRGRGRAAGRVGGCAQVWDTDRR